MEKKKTNSGGRPKNEAAVKLTKELVHEKRLSYRQTALLLEKKLGRKVDTKEVYRWLRYDLKRSGAVDK